MAFKEMTQERLRESAVRCQEQDYEDPAQMAGLWREIFQQKKWRPRLDSNQRPSD